MTSESLDKKRAARKEWLSKLEFFDAYCGLYIDNNSEDFESAIASPVKLLAEMDRNGVSRAVVYHGNTGMVGAAYANNELAEGIRSHADRLTGIWSILPEQCHELPDVEHIFVAMKENNIGALTLFPTWHRWIPNKLTIGRLMEAVTERKVPVYLPLCNGEGGWKWVYDFMKEFPKATTIVTTLGLWGSDRNLRPLLENYPNLHAEMSQYWVPEGITDMAKIYGADKLLYGSGMPKMGFGSTMLSIVNLQLPEGDIEKIASGNIKRLLAWN